MSNTSESCIGDAEQPIFSDWPAPTPKACFATMQCLASLHGMPRRPTGPAPDNDSETAPCGGVANVMDAVIRTVLSQHTSDARSRLAIAGFERRFGQDYSSVRKAPVALIADTIAAGGLSRSKSVVIKNLVETVYMERGNTSLEYLRALSNADIKAALMRYKGIGLKTASCILLLCLGRNSFPVDTHVFRMAKRLGWVPPHATRDQTHHHLETRIPGAWHFPLHVLMIRHGKACPLCAGRVRKAGPARPPCPIG